MGEQGEQSGASDDVPNERGGNDAGQDPGAPTRPSNIRRNASALPAMAWVKSPSAMALVSVSTIQNSPPAVPARIHATDAMRKPAGMPWSRMSSGALSNSGSQTESIAADSAGPTR